MKHLLTILGISFVGLGFIGIFIPMLPTVPFILLAAVCFAKSSPRIHQWLLDHRHFGPGLHHWRTHRSIPKRAKIFAVASIICSGVISIYLVNIIAIKLMIAGLLLIPIFIILRLPNSESVISTKTTTPTND